MDVLNKFLEEMKNLNPVSISELFDLDATFDDYCETGMFNTETHLIGKEAINMHFANRFIFRTYMITDGKVKDDTHAEMDVVSLGLTRKVSVYLKELTDEGKIKSLILNEIK